MVELILYFGQAVQIVEYGDWDRDLVLGKVGTPWQPNER